MAQRDHAVISRRGMDRTGAAIARSPKRTDGNRGAVDRRRADARGSTHRARIRRPHASARGRRARISAAGTRRPISACSSRSLRYVCLLSVDDVWLPGRADAVHAWIEAAPSAVLHLALTAIIDRHGCALGIWRCPLPMSRELSFESVAERLLVQNFIASPTPVFRRDAWMANDGLDESLWYTADWDLWLKLSAAGTVQYHPDVTSGFRIPQRIAHDDRQPKQRRTRAADAHRSGKVPSAAWISFAIR